MPRAAQKYDGRPHALSSMPRLGAGVPAAAIWVARADAIFISSMAFADARSVAWSTRRAKQPATPAIFNS